MGNLTIGFAGIALALVMMAMRMPIAVALGSVAVVGVWLVRGSGAAFALLGSVPYEFSASWSLSAIPMFLLLGAVAFYTGLTSSLYTAARLWLNRMPGGLAIATTFAAAGFAAASGSAMATAAAIGRLAVPEMLKYGYEKGLATATVAAAGTLGALIPPSIGFVIYGWFTAQPIGKLLIAGLLPGILTAVAYSAMIALRAILNPSIAPKVEFVVTFRDQAAALRAVWPMPVLILGVIGSIYGGIATPTEAGALGAVLALLIGAVKGELSLTNFRSSVSETLKTASTIFFVAIAALLFTRFLAMTGVPTYIASAVSMSQASELSVVITMTIAYLFLGMFLEPIGIMLITLPIFLPIFRELGTDLIWIGVLVVKLVEIGCITPPVGLNAFVIKSVIGNAVPMGTIFRGLAWFVLTDLAVVGLLIAIPAISLWLPSFME